jgi:pimeloyl-ACP methyl ester carboxylesterase
LLIWGEQDRLVPLANGRAYADAIPRSSLELIRGAGHSVILEEPHACCDHIAAFLTNGAAGH